MDRKTRRLLAACKALLANVDAGYTRLEWVDNPGVASNLDEMRAAVRDAETPHGVASQPVRS